VLYILVTVFLLGFFNYLVVRSGGAEQRKDAETVAGAFVASTHLILTP
jgi:hypothetical protein